MNNDLLLCFLTQTGAMDDRTAAEVAGTFTEKHLEKGECLVTEGRYTNDYFVAERGCLRGYVYNTEGQDVTTAFYLPGQAVFEVSSFFFRQPARENIQALTDCSGWTLSFEELNGLFHRLPAFRETGRAVLVRGYAALKERMLAQLTQTAEERYRHLLATSPEVFQHAPLKHIASYLGVTDSSLSRIRKDVAGR